MKIISIVGARPQFVKLAPIAEAMSVMGHEHVIIHTGQHYDAGMSESFFSELAIPRPDINLGVGSGSHGAMTGAMLVGLERALLEITSDWVLVYGDTNSTIAGALAATKLGRTVAHLEAGLRSFNRNMPEELNRVATDHLSDLLLAPTQVAAQHLHDEGLAERTILTGDVMTDLCLRMSNRVGDGFTEIAQGLSTRDPFVIATIHRPDNTDTAERLHNILTALGQIRVSVVLAAHPRLVTKAAEQGLDLDSYGLYVREPFTYPEIIVALKSAAGVVTDSGGLQKEAYILGVPCTTIRGETEWVETLVNGWNILDPTASKVAESASRRPPEHIRLPVYGDGSAAARVVEALRTQQRIP